MNLKDKQRLLNKLTRIANDLGYDVGLLSSGADDGEAEMAHVFSNAVDQLRNVQRLLAHRVAREQTDAAVPTVEKHGYSLTDLNDAAEASETIGDDALESFANNQRKK